MFIKIVTVALVITICNGLPPLHPKREEPHSNRAISSQSFTREDVPLAYKFEAVHPYSTTKNPEEPHNSVYSHQRAAYPHTSFQETRKQEPQNKHYLRPVNPQPMQSSYLPHNLNKVPLNSLQYAPIPQNTEKEVFHENPYFKPTTAEDLQKKMVPYRVIFVKPTSDSDLDNMPFRDLKLSKAPSAHSLHLNTYQKSPYQMHNTNTVGMQKIIYPQLLRMFQEHQTSTGVNQRTQLNHLTQRLSDNKDGAPLHQNHRNLVQNDRSQSQLPLHYSTRQRPHFQTDAPKAYQFVPVTNGNHQHHPDRLHQIDDSVQYPTHTQAFFRSNTGHHEAAPSENVKITYLYPVTAPRTPVAQR